MRALANKFLTGNEYGIPSGVVRELASSAFPHTPDYPLLEQYAFHIFFLWGNHMKGQRDYGAVEGTYTGHEGYTSKPAVMYKRTLGKLVTPVVFEPPEKPVISLGSASPAPVWGQLFRLRPSMIPDLDIFMSNGVEFTRKRVEITIPYVAVAKADQFSKPKRVILAERKRAWTYFMNMEYFMELPNYERFTSEGLLKARAGNERYMPRYHFTRNDF